MAWMCVWCSWAFCTLVAPRGKNAHRGENGRYIDGYSTRSNANPFLLCIIDSGWLLLLLYIYYFSKLLMSPSSLSHRLSLPLCSCFVIMMAVVDFLLTFFTSINNNNCLPPPLFLLADIVPNSFATFLTLSLLKFFSNFFPLPLPSLLYWPSLFAIFGFTTALPPLLLLDANDDKAFLQLTAVARDDAASWLFALKTPPPPN